MDYRFKRLKPADGLKPFEKKLHAKLFGGKNSVSDERTGDQVLPGHLQVTSDLYQG